MRSHALRSQALAVGLLGHLTGCTAHDWLSVSDAYRQASSLDGQQVTVRGYMAVSGGVSLIACGPLNPCCNGASFLHSLMPQPSSLHDPYATRTTGIALYPTQPFSSLCSGNECTATCQAFLPRTGQAYELTGRLHTTVLKDCPPPGAPPPDSPPCQGPTIALSLIHLDVAASSLLLDSDLQGDQKRPLAPGPFTLPSSEVW